MTDEQITNLENQLKAQLQAQFTRGLSMGCKSMCGVILEKAKKYNGNNANMVIKDIREFCVKSLALSEPEEK